MSETELEKKVADYVEAAKENKNVDVAALMLNALNVEDENRVPSKTKNWAYLVSIAAPPLGLLFTAWFYFSGKSDSKRVALMCAVLTLVSAGIFLLTLKAFFASSGTSVS
jgi:hypothetical protein